MEVIVVVLGVIGGFAVYENMINPTPTYQAATKYDTVDDSDSDTNTGSTDSEGTTGRYDDNPTNVNTNTSDSYTTPKETTSSASSTKYERTPAKEDAMYTSDGTLRYGTYDPDMMKVRKQLLERWSHYTGVDTEWDMVRLNEITGGFGVSAGDVNWGSIIDEGNGLYSFKVKDSSGNKPISEQPYITKGSETIR